MITPSPCTEHADDFVVVDDDLLTLEFARRCLRNSDVKLSCFSDPLSALAYLQQHTPRVLLVDNRMPRLDGLQLLQTLAESSAAAVTNAFLCSGVVLPADMLAEAEGLGARWLSKDALRSEADYLKLLPRP